MITNFLGSFVTALIGVSVGYGFVLGIRPERRRPLAAALIEIFTFALGAASSEIAFGLNPHLKDGWRDMATRVVLMWLILLPGWYVAARLRRARI
jgi:hypothetical protein